MTKLFKKFNLRAFLTLLTVFTLSFVLAVSTAACSPSSDASTSSSSSSEEDKGSDEQTINNGDFEWYTDEDTKYPYTSSVKWSRSYEGSSSGAYGGIIDTEATAYGKLSDANKPKSGDVVFNPDTPLDANDEDTEANESGTKVLMIRNDSSNKGTAQYFTSSSTVTLDKNEYARISVWVNTFGIEVPLGVQGGAYIKVKTGVDDDAPLFIKNINTGSTVGENGSKWVKYSIYVAPSLTATTNLTVVLGLGDGKTSEHHVNGFAYFDNVEYKIIDKADYDAATATNVADYYSDKNSFVVDENAATVSQNKVVKVNLAKTLSSATIDGSGKYNEANYSSGKKANANDTAGYASTDVSVGGETIQNAVYMDFSSVKNAYSYTSKEFVIDAAAYDTEGKKEDDNGNYKMFSFLAKVKANSSSTTNASVQIIESNTYGENVTAKFDSFTTDGEYARYTFYLTTNYNEEMRFKVRFNFGPTNDKGALPEVSELPQGYAVFKDFSFTDVTLDEYNAADTNNATKVALLGDHAADYSADEDETSNDSYSFTLSDADKFTLKQKPVDLKQTTDKTLSVLKSDASTTIGIVNSAYADDYGIDGLSDALTALKNGIAATDSTNKHVQPLLIKANAGASQSLVGAKVVTVDSNTVYAFSVKVRVVSGQAFVRLFEIAGIDGEDGVITRTVGEQEYSANAIVTKDTAANRDGYVLIQYIIKTGEDAKNIRIEMGLSGEGLALFNSVDGGSSSSYDDAESVILSDYTFGYVEEKLGDDDNKVYYYASKDDVGDLSKRITENGEYKYVTKEPIKAIAYGSPAETSAYESATVRYYRFDVEEMKYEIEASTSDDDTSSSDSSSDSSSEETVSTEIGNYAWLQITSIIIAAVIIIALVAVIVKKILENSKHKKAKTRSYYGGYDQKSANVDASKYSVKNAKKKAIASTSKKDDLNIVAPDEEDNAKAYDYGDENEENSDDESQD